MKILRYIFIFLVVNVTIISIGFLPIWDQELASDTDLDRINNEIPVSEDLRTDFEALEGRLSTTTIENLNELVNIDSVSLSNPTHQKAIASTQKLIDAYLNLPHKVAINCNNEHSCNVSLIRNIGFALVKHADFQFQKGNTAGAKKLITRSFDLSQSLSESEPNSIELLIALAIRKQSIEVVKKHPNIDFDSEEYTIPLTSISAVLRDEYQFFKSAVSFEKSHYWRQPNRTINETAAFTRQAIVISSTPCGTELPPETVLELDTFIAHKQKAVSQPWKQNWLGSAQQSIWLSTITQPLRQQVCALNQDLVTL